MGRKFHHSYSQSEATNQRYRCNPLWRTQLGSGKVSSSNSSSTTTSPNFKRGKPNTIQFPMELKFRTYKNAGKKNRCSKLCLPEHQLDAARTDFQKSFPQTKRNKASERIEFPNGVYLIFRQSPVQNVPRFKIQKLAFQSMNMPLFNTQLVPAKIVPVKKRPWTTKLVSLNTNSHDIHENKKTWFHMICKPSPRIPSAQHSKYPWEYVWGW